MILLPAIDIRGGKAVRLQQGDFERETVYNEDPLEAARAWVAEGARFLHVVDLDGAKAGEPRNLDHLRRIASELEVPVQYGGGLRSLASVDAALAAGAERVVLGTAAFTNPELLGEALSAWGPRVLVAIDVRDGRLSVSGWTEATDAAAADVIAQMQERGAASFVYTSVDRDGMLGGLDLEEIRRIGGVIDGTFIYSGGVGSARDLAALRELGLENLTGVISGKALYEGRFTVAEGNAALGEG